MRRIKKISSSHFDIEIVKNATGVCNSTDDDPSFSISITVPTLSFGCVYKDRSG